MAGRQAARSSFCQIIHSAFQPFSFSARKGFTLAETLITLGIIGLVAALTITVVIPNIQDREFKNAFKKMFSTTAQVVTSIGFDNGGSIRSVAFNNNNSFRNIFSPYFSSIKTCNNGDSSCWTCNGARTNDYFLNGSPAWWYLGRPTIVLKDGTMMTFAYISSTCQGSDVSMIAPYTGTICGVIYVDVNGCKAPNTWGRDIFQIYIQEDKIFPGGPSNINSAGSACNKSASDYTGLQCAEYVINNQDY